MAATVCARTAAQELDRIFPSVGATPNTQLPIQGTSNASLNKLKLLNKLKTINRDFRRYS